ncbi:RNA polymerase subunit sigma-24 [Streptomyces fradiae]|uniref:RNA polymerase sigma factor n=2 Tax=Streptomyces TaxID=1883 RepID=A0A420V9Q3_9ACTN|nr:RNA polymerase subunit sigma-24 [Streptomyces fradiae]OFA55989.1 RNA polymerase subunit sigma-24 [Streptomyces fradiae]PQM25015.1 RNA polymerase sigma factor [Streptomyces xinghaiensis]RKM99065.1 RNA polymerase sigma factor [Streptomyces xinghaiensis]RNC76031.1 RNA polymerase sigma factor [Streptomyces xinghaiensis]
MSGDERRDGLLVVRCQLGEREAFPELVRAWHAPLWRYVRAMVGSPHLAEDLTQEVWVAVVRGLPRLRQPERFAPWLFTIARRAVTDHLRQAYRAPETSLEEADAGTPGDDALGGLLTAMQVEAGLGGLPPPEREVLILFHLQDLPLAACAEVLGAPVGTVKSRLHRARRMLRGILAERGYGHE